MSIGRSRWLLGLAALVACLRFGAAVYKAPPAAKGDFAATLPGAYAKTLNPTLWNSPDLAGSYGYHRDVYVYGPTQYLFLYPIVFLNSYAQIATVLGLFYAALLVFSLFLMARVIATEGHLVGPLLGVIALTLIFPPTYQVYIQREFEVVVFLAIVAATYLLVRGRDHAAAGLLGVITWFKLWPIAFLGYFLIKRQFKAAASFVIASVATLGLAQLVFGLDRFVVNPGVSSTVLSKLSLLAGLLMPLAGSSFYSDGSQWYGRGFCGNWYEGQQTAVGVQWAVCRLAFTYRWLPASLVFYGLLLLAGAFGFVGLWLFNRRSGQMTEQERRRGIVYEISLVTIAAAFVLSTHYYYLVYLTLPLSALAYQYVRDRAWLKLGCLAIAYLLLGAFLLPLSVISRVFGVDFWQFYLAHTYYFYGYLILTGLLLGEYAAIGLRQPELAGDPS